MEAKDWVTASIGVCALIWGIIAFFWNRSGNQKSRALAEKANSIAELAARRLSAESEIAVLRLINHARMRINGISVKMADILAGKKETRLTADQERQIKALESTFNESVEMLLNSYELACGMYLDDKLDRERFKRQYYEEIKKLFDSSPYKELLHPPSSPFKAFRKIHDEWCNFEK